jgi:hypothetical protein
MCVNVISYTSFTNLVDGFVQLGKSIYFGACAAAILLIQISLSVKSSYSQIRSIIKEGCNIMSKKKAVKLNRFTHQYYFSLICN